ncbi:hypothetical protein CC78DRAFT_326912 [Lojkania enalia]|uniref:Uncharacterized protein n=1 Tax=Lojkania enalia TaxID=147567 RepID=A0A9P4K4R0_9PLEO|nr:hypothetical protein CC78DRAFT_326912 [Didymosphaeria enalia]
MVAHKRGVRLFTRTASFTPIARPFLHECVGSGFFPAINHRPRPPTPAHWQRHFITRHNPHSRLMRPCRSAERHAYRGRYALCDCRYSLWTPPRLLTALCTLTLGHQPPLSSLTFQFRAPFQVYRYYNDCKIYIIHAIVIRLNATPTYMHAPH